MFWAFLIFWSYLDALSLFLPRAVFPNVASVSSGIFDRELSRSLVDKWLLVTTLIASDPPNRTVDDVGLGLIG